MTLLRGFVRVSETVYKEGAVKQVFGKWAAAGLALLLAGAALVVVTGATAKSSANIQVCVLLPDTKSSVRWDKLDEALATAKAEIEKVLA